MQDSANFRLQRSSVRAVDAFRRLQALARVNMLQAPIVLQALCLGAMGTVLDALLGALTSPNPGGEPQNSEARRQLIFFCNSLHNKTMRAAPPVVNSRSLTSFTPFYSEDVTYSLAQLTSCLLYTSPSPRDRQKSRMPSSA